MDETGIRPFLERRLSPRSVSSYMSNMRRVERALGVTLESCDFSESGLAGLEGKLRLRARQFTNGSLSDCLTALRTYGEFHNGKPQGIIHMVEKSPVPEKARAAYPTPVPAALSSSSVRDLLVLQSQIIDELRNRNIVRTGNGPVGDYAECIFAAALGWQLQPNSSSGHDATKDGVRYQIKSRRITPRNPSRQLGAIRRLPDKTFDVLAAVLFDNRYEVLKAILIPHELVVQYAKRVEHTNSWRLMLEDWWWSVSGTEDVTQAVRSAASSFDRDHQSVDGRTNPGDVNRARAMHPLFAKVSSLLRRS